MLVHHTKKGKEDDTFDLISGSNGLLAAADGALVLAHRRKTNETVLSITGRDLKEQELAMHFDEATCLWSMLGTAKEYTEKKTADVILEALASGPSMPKEIAAETGILRNTISQTLGRLKKEGRVVSKGVGIWEISSTW